MSKDKLIPELRFPEFTNEGEWDENTIGEVFISFSGGTPNTSEKEYYGGKIPFIRSAEINREKTELFLTEEGLKNSSAKLVNKDDLLVALYGANSGDSAISKISGAINQAILCLQSEYSNAFTYYFLTLKKEWIISKFIQGGQGNLSGDIVKSINVPFPKKNEQQKIASCLSSLDEVIATHSQKLALLKDHKKGLMQNLFPDPSASSGGEKVPKVRFKEFEKDGEWVEKRLGDILEFKNGINAAKEQYGKGIKFINVLDILKDEFITYDNIIGSVDIDEITLIKNSVTFGDVLFQRSSETQEEVGTANVYLDKVNTATFGGFVIRGKKIGNYEPLFLNALLKTRDIRNSISSKAGGSTRFNVGQETLASTNILLPSIQEQQKIASCLSSLDALITAQAEKIEQLQQHKKGLMQGLFPKIEN